MERVISAKWETVNIFEHVREFLCRKTEPISVIYCWWEKL